LVRIRTPAIVSSIDWPPTTLTGTPATVSPSTLDVPEAVLVPVVQLSVWLTLTWPTVIGVAPAIWAESSLALAASVPGVLTVEALGLVTVMAPTVWVPVTSRLSVTQGLAAGLATTGSAVPPEPEERAALARQELLAACAEAPENMSATNTATPAYVARRSRVVCGCE
jgi:hypothetical protein